MSLDPFVAQASMTTASAKEKVDGLKEIIRSTETAMLTTRSADGHLHSRAMAPAHSDEDKELKFVFLANNVSHKFDEMKNDGNVNVAFLNPSTTAWASIAGKVKMTNDRDVVKKYWSKGTSAWFGDLKDGVHKGDETDPRVSVIEVIPEEVRYWYPTEGKVMRAVEIGIDALTGQVASPGELRTLTPKEVLWLFADLSNM
ncbi:Protein bli-3 [Leucoagaricus sp. SymC.cos]|nr:Protein bli-3 [Leucoagaricus sp. SymC.cos]